VLRFVTHRRTIERHDLRAFSPPRQALRDVGQAANKFQVRTSNATHGGFACPVDNEEIA